jgi:hypothetical protein
VPVASTERRFPLFAFRNSNPIIGIPDIEFLVYNFAPDDKFKPTRAGIGSNLAAGINSGFILGAQD